MYLAEFLGILREFEDTQGGRQALSDLKIHTHINGELIKHSVVVHMREAHEIYNGGMWYVFIGDYEDNYLHIELEFIRLGRPSETTWGQLWGMIRKGWDDTRIPEKEQEKASEVMPVSIYICHERDAWLYQVYEKREPLRDLDGLEVKMGEDGIDMYFTYNRVKRIENVRV